YLERGRARAQPPRGQHRQRAPGRIGRRVELRGQEQGLGLFGRQLSRARIARREKVDRACPPGGGRRGCTGGGRGRGLDEDRDRAGVTRGRRRRDVRCQVGEHDLASRVTCIEEPRRDRGVNAPPLGRTEIVVQGVTHDR